MQAIGGVGLFLLGMIVLTDGLRALAGDAMRASLTRFTRSPATGALTGMTTTAILQSSSATTVAAVGFVSAGLLTFPQAFGIILGANIGTTVTGWLVALLGFKLNLGQVIFPFIAVGVGMRLFGKDRVANAGFAIAGFGLIFVGIAAMQAAMAGLQDVITPERLPGPSWAGRLTLVGVGILITIVTQSSSAGIAATITALHADAIAFHQGIALAIGMDVGTTITAMMATIGGSVDARRTGLSHVVFNLMIGTAALFLIGPYITGCDKVLPSLIPNNPEVGLVAFHSLMNITGVLIVLPVARPFAHLIQRILPAKPSLYKRNLDEAFLQDAHLALNAVQDTIGTVFVALLRHINALLGEPTEGLRANVKELDEILDEMHVYLDRIRVALNEGPIWDRYIACLHALDHLQRLHARCEEQEHRATTAAHIPELAKECELLTAASVDVIQHLREKRWFEADKQTAEVRHEIHTQVEPFRESVIARIARDEITVPEGTRELDAIRWLRRVSQHVDKVTHYLAKAVLAAGS